MQIRLDTAGSGLHLYSCVCVVLPVGTGFSSITGSITTLRLQYICGDWMMSRLVSQSVSLVSPRLLSPSLSTGYLFSVLSRLPWSLDWSVHRSLFPCRTYAISGPVRILFFFLPLNCRSTGCTIYTPDTVCRRLHTDTALYTESISCTQKTDSPLTRNTLLCKNPLDVQTLSIHQTMHAYYIYHAGITGIEFVLGIVQN